jgi:phosphoglycerate dehydrogenase-like enzyme
MPMPDQRPLILIANPEPRTVDMIFEPAVFSRLESLGKLVVHTAGSQLMQADLQHHLEAAQIIIGQIDLPAERLQRLGRLRAVINVEGNFLPNIDYDYCFAHGIRVLNASPAFAVPVAEAALGMAIDLARGITRAHEAVRMGAESWGLASNDGCFLFSGSPVGIVGLGDLGRALRLMLMPFHCPVKAYDPWLSRRVIQELDCQPASLEELLSTSRVIFIFAGATKENRGFIGKPQLDLIQRGSILLLMSRADVVDFPAFVGAIEAGRFQAATDVFPSEPLAPGDAVRQVKGLLLSSHRTGGMAEAFFEIGRIVVSDVDLILRGLPPQSCKRAEPETVGRMRSRPVTLS